MKNKILLLIILFVINYGNSQINFIQKNDIIVSENNIIKNNFFAGGFSLPLVNKIDLNNDAIEDIVVFDRANNKFYCFINNGNQSDTSYNFDEKLSEYFPNISSWVIFRDYNCDGKKDIFSSKNAGISVYKNISNSDSIKFELITSNLLYDNINQIFVSSSDIPAIEDVDFDGDMDIITFNISGDRVRYYQNLSIENNNNCNNLTYTLSNNCWGHFSEIGTNSNSLSLYDTCSVNVIDPKLSKHSGSTITLFDINKDSVMDIFLGDVSFRNIVAGINDSIGYNMNTSIISQDTAFPNYNIPIDMELFPYCMFEDVDNDGKKDLLATVNYGSLTENTNQLWYYKNIGIDSNIYQFKKKNFLLDKILDIGSYSHPYLIDYDNDNDNDLIISSFGIFEDNIKKYKSKFFLYENISGNNNEYILNFKSNNFSQLNNIFDGNIFANSLSFADVNNDNKIDMFIGLSNGKILFFNNISNNDTLKYNNFEYLKNNIGNEIVASYYASPELFDVDNDNDFDLLIGTKNGLINYYENTGNQNNYSFELKEDTLGKLIIRESWDIFGSATGYAVPRVYRDNMNNIRFFVSSQSGYILELDNIDFQFPDKYLKIKDTILHQNHSDKRLSAFFFNNHNDTTLDMITGNINGGLLLYNSVSKNEYDSTILKPNSTHIIDIENNSNIDIFPNPIKNYFEINFYNNQDFQNIEIVVYNIFGELVFKDFIKNNNQKIDFTNIKDGMYILKIIDIDTNEIIFIDKLIKN